MDSFKPPANRRHVRPVNPLTTTVSASVQQHLGTVFKLWDELGDFGKDETDAALLHCMERISGLIDAQDGFWTNIVHVMKNASRNKIDADPLFGWRVRAIRPLHSRDQASPLFKKLLKSVETKPGAPSVALAATSGRFRAYTLQSGCLVDVDAFQQTDHYEFYYRSRDIRDRIWIASPVNIDTESIFCFDRMGDKPDFDEAHLELAALALRGIKWFHRQLMLSHGIGLCDEPLTPAERRIIQGLLSGASEREIAEAMKLSPGTVHQYAIRVYQKFGVHGRVEFAALWLSGNPGIKSAHTAPGTAGAPMTG